MSELNELLDPKKWELDRDLCLRYYGYATPRDAMSELLDLRLCLEEARKIILDLIDQPGESVANRQAAVEWRRRWDKNGRLR